MASVVVRDMPAEMHQRLKVAAMRHHRSMNREVLAILENTLEAPDFLDLPPPANSLRPINGATIVKIVRNMRDRAE